MEGYRMFEAKILAKQGMKKHKIADALGVNRRTVYNYLKDRVFVDGRPARGRPAGKSKLDPFTGFIEEKLEEDLYLNGEVLFEILVRHGFTGKTTILSDYLKKRREVLTSYAVRRFETVAGEQAQVDWAECGQVLQNGKWKKLYCFVMKLGFSRRSYMEFTTSMVQPVLFACMKRAFMYFGGVPREILFDNMKTAFIFNKERMKWEAHGKMSVFGAHYGFTPRRCRVRRPQTKGKVEREIRYLKSSFFPLLRLEGKEIERCGCDKLNEYLRGWLERVDLKVIRELQQSRIERFELDRAALQCLPASEYDHRVDVPLNVSMSGRIVFKTNSYSIDASYLGKTLDGRYDPDSSIMTVYHQGKIVKRLNLLPDGGKGEFVEPQDRQSLLEAWTEDCKRFAKHAKRKIDRKRRRTEEQNAVTSPSVYDEAFGISRLQEVPS
jgi:transposase